MRKPGPAPARGTEEDRRRTPTASLSRTASWIIRDRATGRVICETFNGDLAARVDTRTYEAVPILEYLQGLNRIPGTTIRRTAA